MPEWKNEFGSLSNQTPFRSGEALEDWKTWGFLTYPTNPPPAFVSHGDLYPVGIHFKQLGSNDVPGDTAECVITFRGEGEHFNPALMDVNPMTLDFYQSPGGGQVAEIEPLRTELATFGKVPTATTGLLSEIAALCNARTATRYVHFKVKMPDDHSDPNIYRSFFRIINRNNRDRLRLRWSFEVPESYDMGHWRAEFITGGGAFTECKTDTAPTKAGNIITQTFSLAGEKPKIPNAWARTHGMVPSIDSIAIDTDSWLTTLTLSGGEIIQAVINNMMIDVIVVSKAGESDESRVSVEINGTRDILPTSPYSWVINTGRSDLDDALTGFNTTTDRLELFVRPGYVWRWWSGEGTRTFNGYEYEGALIGAGTSLIEISGFEATVDRPSTRAQVKFSMTASDVRRQLQQHLGTIGCDVHYMGSSDGGESYFDIDKRIVGKISGIEYLDAIITADIEDWLSDDHLNSKKWSHESYSQRYPGSKFFEYAAEFDRPGFTFDWPKLPP